MCFKYLIRINVKTIYWENRSIISYFELDLTQHLIIGTIKSVSWKIHNISLIVLQLVLKMAYCLALFVILTYTKLFVVFFQIWHIILHPHIIDFIVFVIWVLYLMISSYNHELCQLFTLVQFFLRFQGFGSFLDFHGNHQIFLYFKVKLWIVHLLWFEGARLLLHLIN